MESNKLNELVNKFWAAECSEQEEQLLKEYLLYGEVKEEHRELSDYMRFMEAERQHTTLDDSFDGKVLDKVDGGSQSLSMWRSVVKYAAGIALLIGVGYGIMNSSESTEGEVVASTEFVDTFDDPEVAYREVKKALMMMSVSMNEGVEATESIGEFHRAQTEIEKN